MCRVVIFSLRATQSQNEKMRLSRPILKYLQISFGVGFVTIANNLVNIVRVLLVNPSYGSETYFQSPSAIADTKHPRQDGSVQYRSGPFPKPPDGTPDHPRQRFWSRRLFDFINIAFLAAIVPSIVANTRFGSGFNSPGSTTRTIRLRQEFELLHCFTPSDTIDLRHVAMRVVGWHYF